MTDSLFYIDAKLRIPLALSVLFHLSVVVFAYYGMPYIKSDPLAIESVSVDIISEKEAEDEIKKSRKIPPRKETPAPPAKPAPPKMERRVQPKVLPPEPPKLNEDISKPVTPAVPPPRPTPAKKKEPPVKAKDSKKENRGRENFSSLLRNLTPHAPDNVQKKAPLTSPGSDSPLKRFMQQVSSTEMEALKQQLAVCWNIPAGAKYAENLVVEVRIFVNPDRTVRDAQVINQNNRDPFFRTAAESALRAVYSPQCNPLNLPPSKYDQWKTIVVRFDPKDML